MKSDTSSHLKHSTIAQLQNLKINIMKEEEKQWFLIKSSWIEWLEDLSMEDRGEFFTALYTKEVPNGIAGAFIKNNIEEFNRVNQYSQKKREINQRNGLSGGAPKGNTNAVKKTTEKQPKNNPTKTHYQPILDKIQPTNKHIDTDIDTSIVIDREIEIDKEIEYSNKIVNNILEDDIQNISYKVFQYKSSTEKESIYNRILEIPESNRTYAQSIILSTYKPVESIIQ